MAGRRGSQVPFPASESVIWVEAGRPPPILLFDFSKRSYNLLGMLDLPVGGNKSWNHGAAGRPKTMLFDSKGACGECCMLRGSYLGPGWGLTSGAFRGVRFLLFSLIIVLISSGCCCFRGAGINPSFFGGRWRRVGCSRGFSFRTLGSDCSTRPQNNVRFGWVDEWMAGWIKRAANAFREHGELLWLMFVCMF